MKRKPASDRCCPNPDCTFYRKLDIGDIVLHWVGLGAAQK